MVFKNLREFFKETGIHPFAENLDYDEILPASSSSFSIDELQGNFQISEEIAIKIHQKFEPTPKVKIQQKKKPKKRLSTIIQKFVNPTPPIKAIPKPVSNPVFENEFENLSDIFYVDGDDWQMDPCSAANAGSCNYFQENHDSEKYEKYSNECGWTPLMYACALNCKEIVAFLLSKNPTNLCAQNNEKQTALMIAASFGHNSIIQQLFKCSKEKESEENKNFKEILGLNIVDENGFTALHYAVFYAHHSTITLLLEFGSDPNTPDLEGMTPTLMACVDEEQEKSLSQLIKAGGNLYHCNHDGQNGYEIANRQSVSAFKSPQTMQPQYGSF
uniref:Ankyrin repeat protein n=1 Tax=Panagrolaimus davidi TaxID=227884 RepID=A0A914QYB5_9BILA